MKTLVASDKWFLFIFQKYGQEEPRCRDSAEQARNDTEEQGQRETFYEACREEVQDDRGNDGGRVGVADGRPRTDESLANGCHLGEAFFLLFLDAFKDEDVRVNRHADGHDEPRNTGQGHRNGYELENGQGDQDINSERERREDTQNAVIHDHENGDERGADGAGDERGTERVRTQGRAYRELVYKRDRRVKRTGIVPLNKLLCLVQRELARDDGFAARYLVLHDRRRNKRVVQKYRKRFADIRFRYLFKDARALFIEFQADLRRRSSRPAELQLRASDETPGQVRVDKVRTRADLLHFAKVQKRRFADLRDCVLHVLDTGELHDKFGTLTRLRDEYLRLGNAKEVHPPFNEDRK